MEETLKEVFERLKNNPGEYYVIPEGKGLVASLPGGKGMIIRDVDFRDMTDEEIKAAIQDRLAREQAANN